MKIVIVAPSGVPFSVGGAEKLWWGLQSHINKATPHQCELIKVPTREENFWDLMESYRTFYEMDLSHFDMVISGKYPAFMVRHPNHHIYMLHCLRGLYDTYHLIDLATDPKKPHPNVVKISDLIDDQKIDISGLFELVFDLRDKPQVPQSTYCFPGPFIRKIIHFLDKKAMSHVRSFSAISKTVADRKAYFPEGARIRVIYPPSNLDYFQSGPYKYFFTASRLDNAKRVELILRAYSNAKTDIPLKIAGTGPLESEMKHLVKNDRRIHFLGHLSDKELIVYYSNAYAVIFVPYDEDYGYVTIEAMMSEKLVITTTTSGGPNEFVVNGRNGFSVEPSPKALAEKIDYLWKNPDKCRQMGRHARCSVENITWENTVSQLVDLGPTAPALKIGPKRRRKLTVVTTYPVYPPRSGGQNRVYHLYRYLAKWYDVEIVALTNYGEKQLNEAIAPGLSEIRIPKSKKHACVEWGEYESKLNVPIGDVAFPLIYKLSPDFIAALRDSTVDADAVVASHPYSLQAIQEVYEGSIWYEAHNVEYDLKRDIIPENRTGNRLLQQTKENESMCCSSSELILACSKEVGDRLVELYGAEPDKIVVVPNGVDLESVKFISFAEKMALKKKMNYDAHFFAFFMGSWHGPNLEAMEFVLGLAEKAPDITFIMIGSGCDYFSNTKLPKNALLLGTVDDETKAVIHSIADIALNPMSSGSGTNLKVLEYMAAGVPVLSTGFGLRGLGIKDGEHAIISRLDEFKSIIKKSLTEPHYNVARRAQRARQYVASNFSYQIISRNLADRLADLLPFGGCFD